MITVISGTNRTGAKTHLFAKKYVEILQGKTEETVNYISLEYIPTDTLHADMYGESGQSEGVKTVQNDCLIPSDKWVVLSPEYNGSFPGVLKLFLDACSIRNYKETFAGKKIGLVGVASGRAGNLRGLDHLAGVFNHVGATVLCNKLPISTIGSVLGENDTINDATLDAMGAHADALLAM